jgi:HEAT repeat protein
LAKAIRPVVKPLVDREPPIVKRIEQLQSQVISETGRFRAAKAIAEMGPEAVVSALDACAAYSATKDTFSFPKPIPQTLAAVGKDLVPGLRAAIKSDKPNVRIAGFQLVSEIRPGDGELVDDLAGAVNDANRFVRSFACKALGNLGADAAPAAEALAAVVRHEDRFTRLRAAEALARIGVPAKTVIPALKEAMEREKVREVVEMLQIAIFEIDLDRVAAEAAKVATEENRELINQLTRSDEQKFVAAAQAISQKGPTAADAVPALALALRHPSKLVREAALKALGTIGQSSRVAMVTMQRAIDDPEADVRVAAQQALQQIGVW